jgi:hypothetical protein
LSGIRGALLIGSSAVVLLSAIGCANRNIVPGPPHEMAASLRARCKGRLSYAGGTIRFEAAFALKPPDRLYVELSGRLGGTRAILAIKGDRLALLFPPDRTYVEERATPEAYEALIGIGMDSESFIAVLESAGRPRVWQVETSAAQGPAATLLVHSDGNRVTVSSSGKTLGAFEGLELRFRGLERPPADPIGDDLFDLSIPADWKRLSLSERSGTDPILFP